MKKRTAKHIGSSFSAFLEEEGIREDVEAAAVKQVIAWQLQEFLRSGELTKASMARQMHTSRAVIDRLLDPSNLSVTLNTLAKAAAVVGKKLQLKLVDAV